MKLKILIVVFFAHVMFSCDFIRGNQPKMSSTTELLDADKGFADMCRQLGMKKAFMEYIDNEGVLLRANHPPVFGADAIDFLSLVNDSAYSLSWKPSNAIIAHSGELGYTYGIYELSTPDTVYKGTYVNIWKRKNNGVWKLMLDSRSEGISEEE